MQVAGVEPQIPPSLEGLNVVDIHAGSVAGRDPAGCAAAGARELFIAGTFPFWRAVERTDLIARRPSLSDAPLHGLQGDIEPRGTPKTGH